RKSLRRIYLSERVGIIWPTIFVAIRVKPYSRLPCRERNSSGSLSNMGMPYHVIWEQPRLWHESLKLYVPISSPASHLKTSVENPVKVPESLRENRRGPGLSSH